MKMIRTFAVGAILFSSFTASAAPCENFQAESLEYKTCLYNFYTKDVSKPVIGNNKISRKISSVDKGIQEGKQYEIMEEDYINY